jgi:heme O synthase-like polyprenyltransferase
MTRASRLAETNVMAARLAASEPSRWTGMLADYWTLTKPEVNFLILVTTFAGFYLASPASH